MDCTMVNIEYKYPNGSSGWDNEPSFDANISPYAELINTYAKDEIFTYRLRSMCQRINMKHVAFIKIDEPLIKSSKFNDLKTKITILFDGIKKPFRIGVRETEEQIIARLLSSNENPNIVHYFTDGQQTIIFKEERTLEVMTESLIKEDS